MHSTPIEATAVAILLVALWFAMHGGFPVPTRFGLRTILAGVAIVAALLGIIAYAARN
jgi:hypothetical protein